MNPPGGSRDNFSFRFVIGACESHEAHSHRSLLQIEAFPRSFQGLTIGKIYSALRADSTLNSAANYFLDFSIDNLIKGFRDLPPVDTLQSSPTIEI